MCDVKIANRDNVPVVSWLLLRGRCRNCGTAISARYPFVELLTGVLFAAVGARFSHSWALPAYLVLTGALVALSAIDLEHYILPNRILYPADAAVIVLLAVASAAEHDWGALGRARIAGAISFAVFFAIHIVSPKRHGLRRRTPLVPSRLEPGLVGLGRGRRGPVRGLSLRRRGRCGADRSEGPGRKQQIPFGPFLAAGAMTFVLFGEPLVDWYRHLGR